MSGESQQEAIVRWLATPAAYSHRPRQVKHVQTHISHVFLAGGYAYKLKKAVRYDFLDFSTPAAREHACREELRLNRRLAPDAYLDVVPITQTADGGYEIGGDGQPIDWLVHMRRLPVDLTLDALFQRGELRPEHIDRLAATLIRFYRSLPPLPLTPTQYRERCQTHARSNLRELLAVKHHLPRGLVERIHAFQLQLLLLEPSIIEERAAQGRIVDGHGDLRPEHICLSDPVAIFDCIEFNPEFRSIDVADELAFLAAECDFLGAGWVGPQLFAAYQEQGDDRPPPVLVDFYKSYRACVRAKVAALRGDQLAETEQPSFATEAARHLILADRYASHWLRPLVLVVGGLSGTGKSTLAKALADAFAAELLRTDVIRQELWGGKVIAAAIDRGAYAPPERSRVYDELFRRAANLHATGISVVLDGTFSTVEQLRRAEALATDPRRLWLAIECTCTPEVALQRIQQRLSDGHDSSTAGSEVYDHQRLRWEAWTSEIPHIRLDTEQSFQQQVDEVIAKLRLLAAP